VCESVKEDKASIAKVEAERKLAAVAESNECSVCVGHKNHVSIPCGKLNRLRGTLFSCTPSQMSGSVRTPCVQMCTPIKMKYFVPRLLLV